MVARSFVWFVFSGFLAISNPEYSSAKQVVYSKLPASEDKSAKVYRLKARVTYYHRFQDSFGNKVAMHPAMKAKEGLTAAAHPHFPFGTRIYIPELKGVLNKSGIFVVQDRGTAITKKKASRGKTYVFDIYLEADSKYTAARKLQSMQREASDYMDVFVTKS